MMYNTQHIAMYISIMYILIIQSPNLWIQPSTRCHASGDRRRHRGAAAEATGAGGEGGRGGGGRNTMATLWVNQWRFHGVMVSYGLEYGIFIWDNTGILMNIASGN